MKMKLHRNSYKDVEIFIFSKNECFRYLDTFYINSRKPTKNFTRPLLEAYLQKDL